MSVFSNSRSLVWLVSIVALVAISACRAASAEPQIECHDAWGRTSPMNAVNGAIYLVIENQGGEDDRLIGATSPAAAVVELHEHIEESGVMKMRPVEGVDVPAGSRVEFKPGGYHVMLIGLVQELQAGSTISVTLLFAKSGEITLDAEIKQP